MLFYRQARRVKYRKGGIPQLGVLFTTKRDATAAYYELRQVLAQRALYAPKPKMMLRLLKELEREAFPEE